MKILLTAINAKFIHTNPAVYLLRAFLGPLKDNVEIAEYTINQQKEFILADIYERQPDVLLFSCYIWNKKLLSAILPELPKILPEVPVFLGGPEVSYNAPELLRTFPKITGILAGEGEETFKELAEYYLKSAQTEPHNAPVLPVGIKFKEDSSPGVSSDNSGEYRRSAEMLSENAGEYSCAAEAFSYSSASGLNNIRGLFLRNESGEGVFFTGDRPLISMDDIPFFYEEFADEPELGPFKNRILYYETGRGCPFNCSYCLSSIDKKLRFRSLEKVFSELRFFLDHKVPQVKFIDRTFNCDRERALAIWQYLKDHDNGITNFHFEIAGDLLSGEEIALLQSMRPGLLQLEIGVQSTNPETLSEIHRKTDLKKLRENTGLLYGPRNIHRHLDLIAGLPYEDLESFRESFNALYRMAPDQLQLGFLKVLHGTFMEEHREEYALQALSEPPYEVLSTKWLSYRDLLLLKKIEAVLEIYYNSGQFTKTLSVLVPLFETPFSFFEKLALFYEKSGSFLNRPARISRYELLLSFAIKCFPEKEALIKELLTFDLYLRENMKSRPAFSAELRPYKGLLREKETAVNQHIDVFFYPVYKACLSAEEMNQPLPSPAFIRFDYDKRDPLTYNAAYEVV